MPNRWLEKLSCVFLILFCIASCKSMVKIASDKSPAGSEDTINDYFLHRDIMTTYFYVGEYALTDSRVIDNRSSAWTANWIEFYGNIDSPEKRADYLPEGFTPKENPFYFALPYNDLTRDGYKEKIQEIIPWVDDSEHAQREWPYSYCKNRWIRIIYNDRVCYAQWEDVGPYETDDWQYVFGNRGPRNLLGGGAGLDVSPACIHYLGMKDNDRVHWQFVDFENVPEGPWKQIITASDPYWN